MIGQTIGHYKILDLLGKGGMGKVYRAEDTTLKRQIALKVLPPDLVDSEQRLRRFRREAEVLAGLNHPNIVVLHSVSEADGIHYLTMELVEGKPLTRILRTGGLPVDTYFKIAVPLVEALSAAHEKGIVHRDLKPDNIMVSDHGIVKVLDFGLAKLTAPFTSEGATDIPTESLTADDQVLGTVPYMSPEQVRGEEVNHQSDIFSLGVVLHEMATGKRLFHGTSSLHVASAILTKEPKPISETRSDLPFHLSRIVSHCLVKDQAHRYQSTRDLSDELEGLKKEVESGQVRTRSLSAQRTPTGLFTRRRLGLLAAAALVLVVAAASYISSREAGNKVTGYEAIAVMPFDNLIGDPSQDYLSEGLSTGLINSLSEVAGLSVVSKSEAWSHRALGLSARLLAGELEVEALIGGDLQLRDGALQASATLIDGRTGLVLWTDQFVGEDVASIGQKMARRIAGVLSIPLTARERRRMARDPTKSLKAYDYYLQGEQFLEEVSTPRHADLAADLFQQAIRLDDSFPLAHVGLSEALWKRYQRDKDPALLVRAEDEATLALELDPELPAARVARARVYRSSGRYALSIAELRQVLAGHPHPDRAMRELAFGYEEAGDLESAEESLRAAVALEESSWRSWHSLGSFLMRNSRYPEAKGALARAAQRAPESITWPQEGLATIMIVEADYAGAVKAFEELGFSTQNPLLADNMATAYFFLDRLDDAEALYKMAVSLNPTDPRFHGNLGDLYERQNHSELARSEYSRASELAELATKRNPRNIELRLDQTIYAAKAERCYTALDLADQLEPELPPTAFNMHDLALVYALCEHRQGAMGALATAVKQGFSTEHIRAEDEFQLLWDEPEFQALVGTGTSD